MGRHDFNGRVMAGPWKARLVIAYNSLTDSQCLSSLDTTDGPLQPLSVITLKVVRTSRVGKHTHFAIENLSPK